jgi:hypothetical protein
MRLVVALLVIASLGAPSPGGAAAGGAALLLRVADRVALATVLRQIDQRWPGRALAARTIERNGRSFYVIKWLGADGKVRDITADALSGEVLRVR